jgi:hypothetical protein
MLPLHATQEALFLTKAEIDAGESQVEGDGLVQRSEQAPGNWLTRLMDRLEAQAWERERREMDEYLADATDLADLEDRIRRYDRRSAEGNAMFRN